jgi:hypothetical protein
MTRNSAPSESLPEIVQTRAYRFVTNFRESEATAGSFWRLAPSPTSLTEHSPGDDLREAHQLTGACFSLDVSYRDTASITGLGRSATFAKVRLWRI